VRYLIDSTLLIDHGNGDSGAIAMVARLFEEGHELFVCDVVTSETLSFGAATAADLRRMETLLDAFEYVSTSPNAARWAGASRRARHRAGGKRAVADALVAGVAHDLGAIVVTRNLPDFAAQSIQTLTY
jgi:predicted nucleic acid-binding protein